MITVQGFLNRPRAAPLPQVIVNTKVTWIDDAVSILGDDVILISQISAKLGIASALEENYRFMYVPATKFQLRALKGRVRLIPRHATLKHLQARCGKLLIVDPGVLADMRVRPDLEAPNMGGYRIILKDLSLEEREVTRRIAQKMGLSEGKLSLTTTVTAALIARLLWGERLKRPYLGEAQTFSGNVPLVESSLLGDIAVHSARKGSHLPAIGFSSNIPQ